MVTRDRFVEVFLQVVAGTLKGGPPLGPKTSIIDSGLVDSFGIADLVRRLEAALGATIPTDRLSPGDFDTADRLADRLTRLGVVSG